MSVSKKLFGNVTNGSEANLYTIKNLNGTKVEITNYGATIVSVKLQIKMVHLKM